MKIKLNPDKEYVKEMKQKLKENNNFCPCQIRKDNNDVSTKCMCKIFREQKENGYCHCGLYYKENEEELNK